MGLHILAEALARIEYKLDALMRHLQIPMPPPMHFYGALCPACASVVDYQIDLVNNVVVRKCSCSTGKYVSAVPLFPAPTPQGAENAGPDPVSTEDSSEREDRRARNR